MYVFPKEQNAVYMNVPLYTKSWIKLPNGLLGLLLAC